MKTPLDSARTISTIWEQTTKGQAIAHAAGQPFTDTQLINRAYHCIFVSGLLNEDYYQWLRRPAAAKTQ
eukprot:8480481-Ditylum_brightwellii.AAC.1